jgi:hypothetical protein
VYTPGEYNKLIEQSRKRGKFSVTVCKDINTEYKRWWPKFYKKNTMSIQSYVKAISRAQKVNFSFSQYYMCEYSSQRPGEVIITNITDGFITNNFRLLSVLNKIRDLSKEKAFPNGTCPINVKKMDDKQVMKYTDHKHQDFWTLF